MRAMLRYAAVAVLLLPAACSGGAGSASPTASAATMSDADLLALGKQLAQCYRDNGVADFPEPYVDDGRLAVTEAQMEAIEQYTDEQQNRAEQACKSIYDKLPQGAIKSGAEDDPPVAGPEDVEALRKFAQCIREQGLTDWPDPNADGTFPLRGTKYGPPEGGGGPDRQPVVPDAQQRAAHKACEQHYSGNIRIS